MQWAGTHASGIMWSVIGAGIFVDKYMTDHPELAEAIGDNFKDMANGLSEIYNSLEWNDLINVLTGATAFTPSPLTNIFFMLAGHLLPPRDPLALDLDGNGITSISADEGILLDKASIVTGTGWLTER